MQATTRMDQTGPLSDPRSFQILALSGMLAYGLSRLDFTQYIGLFPVYVGSALITQFIGLKLLRRMRPELPIRFEFQSALISSLSLCLLLRVGSPYLAVLAGVLTIAGKFLIRYNGKHIFNPSLFGILAVVLLSDAAWISPGQWGREGLLLFGVCCAGGMVLFRALRSDISLAFLGAYCGLVLARGLYLGDPLAITVHQLSNGALLIFAFFMISDPKSTPDARPGRVLFAVAVAATAVYMQFVQYNTGGLLWSLGLWSLAVPLIDRILPAARYEWRAPNHSSQPSENNHEHEQTRADHSRAYDRHALVQPGVQ